MIQLVHGYSDYEVWCLLHSLLGKDLVKEPLQSRNNSTVETSIFKPDSVDSVEMIVLFECDVIVESVFIWAVLDFLE